MENENETPIIPGEKPEVKSEKKTRAPRTPRTKRKDDSAATPSLIPDAPSIPASADQPKEKDENTSPAPVNQTAPPQENSILVPMPQPRKITRHADSLEENSSDIDPIPENVQPDLLVPPTVVPVEPSETSAPYQNEDKSSYLEDGEYSAPREPARTSAPLPVRDPMEDSRQNGNEQREFYRRDNNRQNNYNDRQNNFNDRGDNRQRHFNNNNNGQQNNRYNNRNNNNNNRRFLPNNNRYQQQGYQQNNGQQNGNGAQQNAVPQIPRDENAPLPQNPEMPQQVREKAPDLNITELQEKSMQELTVMARDLGIEGVGALEKSKLVFEILRVTTERSGAVYGSGFLEILPDGFGFLPDPKAGMVKIPQIGIARLDDGVEIGAFSSVDRATFGETYIGKCTKIDSHVKIGHNCQIGAYTIIVAQSGIAGSSHIGNRVIMAAQSGTANHASVGDGCTVGGRGGVTADVPAGSIVSGFPAQDHRKELRLQAAVRQLPEMASSVKELGKRMAALEKRLEDENA